MSSGNTDEYVRPNIFFLFGAVVAAEAAVAVAALPPLAAWLVLAFFNAITDAAGSDVLSVCDDRAEDNITVDD